jgi:hypothetical protein
VAAADFGEVAVEEVDFAGAFHAAVVAGDVEAFDFEGARDAAEEVCGEDEGAFEEDDDDECAAGEVAFDFEGHGVEAFFDDCFVDEDSLDVVAHGWEGRLGI